MTGSEHQHLRVIGLLIISLFLPGTIAAAKPRHEQPSVVGPATVIDGDTIIVQGQHIRLWGMDAPEEGKTCTRRDGTVVNIHDTALVALTEVIGISPVRCEYRMTDRRGRPVHICSVNGGDLGGALVAQGRARDWPYFSNGYYAAQDAEAKAAHRGIWGMTCDDPFSGRPLTRPVQQKMKS